MLDNVIWLSKFGTWLSEMVKELIAITPQLAEGLLISLLIFATTLVIALPLGLGISFARMSKIKFFSFIAKVYISIMRGTPLMLQLMVIFFAPSLVFNIKTTAFFRYLAVIIGFGLNYAAYFAEIYRAGIEAIPVGQYEAATVLGYTRGQTFRRIIFPQVVKRIIPPVTNEVITLVKDTSLAFVIAVEEMFTVAKQMVAARGIIMPFVVAAIFYYLLNVIVAWIMSRIEKKLSYYTIK